MKGIGPHLQAFVLTHMATADVLDGTASEPDYGRLREIFTRLDVNDLRRLSTVAEELFVEASLAGMAKLGHICDYVDVDGTTNGTCHLPGAHVGLCWICTQTAPECDHVGFEAITCEVDGCMVHPRAGRDISAEEVMIVGGEKSEDAQGFEDALDAEEADQEAQAGQ